MEQGEREKFAVIPATDEPVPVRNENLIWCQIDID